MKKVEKMYNGEKVVVWEANIKKPLDIIKVGTRRVQKKDGTWTDLREVTTNYGKAVISKEFYEVLMRGEPIEDDKIYLTVGYLGIVGQGGSNMQGFSM